MNVWKTDERDAVWLTLCGTVQEDVEEQTRAGGVLTSEIVLSLNKNY